MTEWIDVEERLPEDSTRVAVTGSYNSGGPKMLLHSAELRRGIWFRDNGGYGFTVSCNPTHWMPLTELPLKPE